MSIGGEGLLALWGALLTVLLVTWLAAQFVLVPFIRQEMRRRAARKHTPQPEEIWVQDDELLYIDATSPSGVEIIHWDAQGKTVNRWKDTWPEWQKRVSARNLWWTGQRKPLGNG